ncbi:MAG: hypothetical protein P9M03_06660, partial [Candidatus Theseobacter exili]|nr:hypothetical protein [Candidatus Theseobacter exili]
ESRKESVLYVLGKEKPDVIEMYNRIGDLSKEEISRLRREIYGITYRDFSEWGLYGAMDRRKSPEFNASHADALIMVFNHPRLNLNKDGFSRLSPHFSLTTDGLVAGANVITESVVQPRMKAILDGVGITRDSATWSGEVQSFTVGELVAQEHEDEFFTDLSAFFQDRFNGEEIVDLNDLWLMFMGDEALDGKVALAENENGAVYMHFGLGGGKALPTIYTGRRLVEFLLDKDKDSLERLIRYELNRKEVRQQGQKDARSSQEVARASGLTGEALSQVVSSIESAEVKALLEKPAGDIAAAITSAANELGQKPARMRRRIIERVAQDFAAQLGEQEQAKALAVDEAQRQMKGTESRGLEQAADVFRQQITEALQDTLAGGMDVSQMEVNLWENKVYFSTVDGTRKEVFIDRETQNAMSFMLGKRVGSAGEIEWIIVDLARNAETGEKSQRLADSINELFAGDPIEENGKEEIAEKLIAIERMSLHGVETLHVSRGHATVGSVRDRADKINESQAYFSNQSEKKVPVLVDRVMLQQMGLEQRKAFIEKHGQWIALGYVVDGEVEPVPEEDLDTLLDILDVSFDKQTILRNIQLYLSTPEDNRVVVLSAESSADLPDILDASILPVRVSLKESDLQIDHVMDVAAYIAQVGRRALIEGGDSMANEMLRQLLRELYSQGELPEDLMDLDNVTFADLLEHPEKLMFPPISTQEVADIESYLRASKAIETMA